MQGRPARLAALICAPLLFATPVLAQAQPDGGTNQRTTLGPSYAEMQGRQSEFVGENGALFPESRGKGVGVSAQPFVRDDGTRGDRTGLVGSMPVAPNMNLGLGLFQVNRTNGRERDMQRLRPMRDVGGRNSTMAAVGLSVRFR